MQSVEAFACFQISNTRSHCIAWISGPLNDTHIRSSRCSIFNLFLFIYLMAFFLENPTHLWAWEASKASMWLRWRGCWKTISCLVCFGLVKAKQVSLKFMISNHYKYIVHTSMYPIYVGKVGDIQNKELCREIDSLCQNVRLGCMIKQLSLFH